MQTSDYNPGKDKSHSAMINMLAWHPVNDIVATAGSDKSIKLYDIRSRDRLFELSTKGSPRHSGSTLFLYYLMPFAAANYVVEWSKDGNYVYYADRDCKIHCLDTRTWEVGFQHFF